MGEIITLTAKDGFSFAAYKADPTGTAKGGLLVVQEIFGLNAHIRSVADRFAAEGFLVIAPALFDRAERGIELGYTQEDVATGAAIRAKVPNDRALEDIAACVSTMSGAGKVGVVGYCWGGTLSWAAACHTPGIAASVCYYGSGIASMLDQIPKGPTILHFGSLDKHIPLTDVDKIKAAFPHLSVFVYDADHGFNCDARASFNAPAADLAQARTLEFLADRLGQP